MMDDNEFKNLEKRYLEEKEKRQELEKIANHRDHLAKALKKLEDAKDSPYADIYDMKIACFISYSDCEGRREIDKAMIQFGLDYDQFVNIIKSELEKTNKEIKAKKEALGLK